MSAKQFYIPYPTAFNSNGLAVPGAQFFFYLAGTTTKTTIYTDSGLTVPAENPVVANGAGRIPTIYLNESVALRLKILDASGADLDDIDNFIPGTFYGPPVPLTITSANGVSVSSRTALAAVASPVADQTARLSEIDREGDFTFESGDHSAAVTAETSLNLSQGAVIAPASDTSGASGVWARPKSELYEALATVWGCKFDGVTDDTIAFQGTSSYCSNNGYTMLCPPRRAIINGPLQDTSFSNAQILLPQVTDLNAPQTVRIRGACAVPMTCEPTAGGNYTILESNLASAGSFIGAKSHTGFQNRTCISFYLEDLIVRLPQDSAAIAVDCRYVHMSALRNVVVDVPDVFNCVQPTHASNVGVYMPLLDVSGWSILDNVAVRGYRVGHKIGELVTAPFIHAAFCYWPISFQEGSFGHAAIIESALVTNCPHTILAEGTLQLEIGLLNIEHDTAYTSGGSGPNWVEPFGNDVEDAPDSLRGRIVVQMHDTSIPLAVNGARNLRIDYIRPPSEHSSYGTLYTNMEGDTNASSVRALRSMFGGIPMRVFLGSTASTTGEIGRQTWANDQSAHTDVRLVDVRARCDGATDKGRLSYYVWNAGTPLLAFEIDHLGNIILPAKVSAADDTAAATANVPVGGLYHNAGAVRVRLT